MLKMNVFSVTEFLCPIRQVLRKIGVDRLVITPEGDGWRFAGAADFAGLVHGRVKAGPPKPPVARSDPA